MRRILLAAAATTAAALTLSACGTTEPAADKKDDKKSSAGQAITLTDGTGAKVKLDAPAKKVVATEWNVVETLITLGVDPAGVSDVKGYKQWDQAVPLTNDAKDVGTRGEPSMDSIAALAPDLIVATTDLPEAAIKQLKGIGKVITIKPADAKDPVGQMTKNLDLIAEATGTTDKAAEVKKDFQAKIDEGKKALADAGLEGANIAFADGYVVSNQAAIRPFTSGSLLGGINEQLGLKNAWTVEGDPAYGLGQTDVEGLTKLPEDVHFAYIGNEGDKASTPFTGILADDKVWTSLSFVEEGNVHRLDDGIWMFGGPGSMSAYIDGLVKALTK
ncbi:ABC transporter substrate-binding protein [Streptomyces sp. KLOTTS4A1]|uniref:ABC transporter substrate-binding protein n=1 Tax=Streptomyces sp. KLOTTS4A1 TaxID=3390996 RepID=UPI0039F4A2C1